ncbi:MAG: ATP-binding protein, partial [Proteobacteria bacterium]|nr:ATP-binding protein [Pseudomonadota bacterium]
ASISGSVELLRSAETASEEDRALMTIVHREIQRLNTLIGDLLDYANPRPKQIVEFDLATLIGEILQVAKGDRAFEAVEVASAPMPSLPLMNGDPAKLRQVVWNLLRNASDAASAGGKHVRASASIDGALVTIEVADDGPGIPLDQLTRVFDPFYTTKHKGTGLGLATCHAIIAEHGGRIDVESEPGNTRFLVRLPR